MRDPPGAEREKRRSGNWDYGGFDTAARLAWARVVARGEWWRVAGPGLPHIVIELRQALSPYQDHHIIIHNHRYEAGDLDV